MKKISNVLMFLTLIAIALISCKKDVVEPPTHALHGNWEESDLNGLSRRLSFSNDQSFQLSIAYTDGGSTVFLGTYQINGASIKVNIQEMQEQQPNKPLIRTASSANLYEDATYSIDTNVLLLNYTSYPADAPVATTAKFNRIIAID
jgi:hypothetical protein